MSQLPDLRETIEFERDWETFLDHGELVERRELAEREASLGFDDPFVTSYDAPDALSLPAAVTLTHHDVLSQARAIAAAQVASETDRV